MKSNLLCLILLIMIIGCASPPPLPTTLNILAPSQDVPPELATFVGIWEGKWAGMQDTIIVIEKVDSQKADIIISYGSLVQGAGFKPPDRYRRITATVMQGPVLEFYEATEENPSACDSCDYVCPCKATFQLNREENTLIAYWEYIDYGMKVPAELKKRK